MAIRARSVGVVGLGNVGRAAAYAMYLQEVCEELVLVDLDPELAHGEALDLMHGQGLTGRMSVRSGQIKDLTECQVIVLTAGSPQRPGQSRLDLLEKNTAIFASLAEDLDQYAPTAVLVLASNPVDVATYMLQTLSERPARKVIGTGTMLDTTRLRTLVGEHYDVDPQSVHGYVLGEHGDSEVAIWSGMTIGGAPIQGESLLGIPYDQRALDQIAVDVVESAYQIIEAKGYTNLAIGVVIARLVDAILDDRRSMLPVSVRLTGEYGITDVALSLPAQVGQHGVGRILELQLSASEVARIRESARTMRDSLASVGF